MNHNWISNNYDKIMQWAKNIAKGDPLYEELCHYSIEQFMQHKRYIQICEKDALEPTYGHCRGFILAIMRNSWIGKKSHFSRIHKSHRADIGHRKRNITETRFNNLLEAQDIEEYDFEQDFLIESIEGILEEMDISHDSKLWYNSRLFQMYLQTPNYSELSRRTDIPRTSISNAVDEAKEYILQELKARDIIQM